LAGQALEKGSGKEALPGKHVIIILKVSTKIQVCRF